MPQAQATVKIGADTRDVTRAMKGVIDSINEVRKSVSQQVAEMRAKGREDAAIYSAASSSMRRQGKDFASLRAQATASYISEMSELRATGMTGENVRNRMKAATEKYRQALASVAEAERAHKDQMASSASLRGHAEAAKRLADDIKQTRTWANEHTAALQKRAYGLKAEGRVFDAQRMNARAAHFAEVAQLQLIAKTGENVGNRLKAAYAKYQSELAQISAAEKKHQRDLEDSARKAEATRAREARAAKAARFAPAQQASDRLLLGVGLAASGVMAAGVKSVGMYGEMEQAQIGFTTMLRSASAAKKMIADIYAMAAKTPFQFADLTEYTRRLIGMGVAAKDVLPMMTTIGDAVSALGGGAEKLDQVTLAMGQMITKGKVNSEEMSRQLAEAGIPAWKYLADYIGTSIPNAMKKVEKGMVPASVGIKAILGGMRKDFGGGMERQSQTVLGLWSTVKDNISMTAMAIGDALNKAFNIKGLMKGAIDLMGRFTDAVQKSGGDISAAMDQVFPNMKLGILVVAGAITGALVPAMVKLATATWAALVPLLPYIAIGAAVGLVAYGIYRLVQSSEPLRKAFSNVATTLREGLVKALEWIGTQWEKIRPSVVALWKEVSGYVSKVVAAIQVLADQPAVIAFIKTLKQLFEAWVTNTVSGVKLILNGVVKLISVMGYMIDQVMVFAVMLGKMDIYDYLNYINESQGKIADLKKMLKEENAPGKPGGKSPSDEVAKQSKEPVWTTLNDVWKKLNVAGVKSGSFENPQVAAIKEGNSTLKQIQHDLKAALGGQDHVNLKLSGGQTW